MISLEGHLYLSAVPSVDLWAAGSTEVPAVLGADNTEVAEPVAEAGSAVDTVVAAVAVPSAGQGNQGIPDKPDTVEPAAADPEEGSTEVAVAVSSVAPAGTDRTAAGTEETAGSSASAPRGFQERKCQRRRLSPAAVCCRHRIRV